MNFEKLSGGYWKVNSKKFYSKFDALKYATDTKQRVEYSFFDDQFNSVNKSLLGRQNLNDLYRQRAQQLRDEYDYLILYFSGGADSYNVLRSFIDNNIPLDEICVKWPMMAINKEFYNANTKDTSAYNYLSEWDYAIKPVLDSLKQTHPEIKIEIVDWTENYNPAVYSEELVKKIGAWNDVEMPMLVTYSPSELLFYDKGKTVAAIYGVDKPIIGHHENKWFINFPDTATGMGIAQDHSLNNVEYFYWSPKMPEIAFEQAFVVCNYLESHPSLLKYFWTKEKNNSTPSLLDLIQIQNDIIKDLIYNNWSGVFQANKPISRDRADKQFWIFNRAEFGRHRDSFIDLNSLALTQIDSKFYNTEDQGIQYKNKIRGMFKPVWSKWHFVKHMDIV
jgi:hypothetical protein